MRSRIRIVILIFLLAASSHLIFGCTSSQEMKAPNMDRVRHIEDLTTRPVIIDLTEGRRE